MVGFYAFGAASLVLAVTNYTNLTNAANRVNRQKTLGFSNIARILQNPQSRKPLYVAPQKSKTGPKLGDGMQFLTDWNPDYYTTQNHGT